ncbi:MAG: tRNA (adenosine(37)-N6)-threonylcarbamoyltransferase complex dimerization subunit type 1 TsaB [Pseudomonadota bacterium]
MITLAVDTCLDACSVALFDATGQGLLAGRHEPMSRGHAEALLPQIDDVFTEAGFRPDALEQVIVTRGPGTFTGVRIGISAARGLGIGTGVQIRALSSLRAIALCAIAADQPVIPVAAVIDARRDELYAAVYSPEGQELRAPELVSVNSGAACLPEGPVLLAGSGAAQLLGQYDRLQASATPPLPDARIWGPIAARHPELLQDPVPLYLRQPDAKPPSPDSQAKRVPE